jgi:Glycosyl transferase family 2
MPPSPPPFATTGDVRRSPAVSVVIPVLDEEGNLPLVLAGLPPVDEVVVVDGGSADATVAAARRARPDAVVVRQTRGGKGNALACGFAASTGDIVVTLDGDGSADPGELPRLVDALLAGAEAAHGSRYRDGGADLAGGRLTRLGNRLLARLVNLLFGTRFTDLCCGYNAIWRTVLPALGLPPAGDPGLRRGRRPRGDGPEIEPLINIRMAAQGLRVVEVASVGYPRIHGSRPRRPVRACGRAVWTALAEYGRRRRIGPAATGTTRRVPPYGAGPGTLSYPEPPAGSVKPLERSVRPPAPTSPASTPPDRTAASGGVAAWGAHVAAGRHSAAEQDDRPAPAARGGARRTDTWLADLRDDGARPRHGYTRRRDDIGAAGPADAPAGDAGPGDAGPGDGPRPPGPDDAGHPRSRHGDLDADVPGTGSRRIGHVGARHADLIHPDLPATAARHAAPERAGGPTQARSRAADRRGRPAHAGEPEEWPSPPVARGADSPRRAPGLAAGARRRRPEPWEDGAGRPDLTVIAGDGAGRLDPLHAPRPGHLRAVPGESYESYGRRRG